MVFPFLDINIYKKTKKLSIYTSKYLRFSFIYKQIKKMFNFGIEKKYSFGIMVLRYEDI